MILKNETLIKKKTHNLSKKQVFNTVFCDLQINSLRLVSTNAKIYLELEYISCSWESVKIIFQIRRLKSGK